MSLRANILPVFEQLNLLEELKAIALPSPSAWQLNEKLEPIGEIKMKGQEVL